jgi:hypothetical protein
MKTMAIIIFILFQLCYLSGQEAYELSIDKTPLSGMPWDLLEKSPIDAFKRKSVSDVIAFDHVLVISATQSGKTVVELKAEFENLIKLGAIADSPKESLQATSGYYSYSLWKNGGIVGYIHVINSDKYVVTALVNYAPINYYYSVNKK